MVVVNLVLDKRAKIAVAAFVATVIILLIVSMIIVSGQTAERNAETTEARLYFLKSNGYACENEIYKEISIPDSLDEVYINYNKIQMQQGFNLVNYLGQKVEFYTYTVVNYPNEKDVYAHLIVKDGCVIGGDIASARIDGFMHGIVNIVNQSENQNR